MFWTRVAVLVLLWVPANGQVGQTRDLLNLPPADPWSQVFAVSFVEKGRIGTAPNPAGAGELEAAALAYRDCRDCVLIVEASAYDQGGTGLDPSSSRSRAEVVRRYLAERAAFPLDRVLVLLRVGESAAGGTPQTPTALGPGVVKIRRWAEEQMADLAPLLVPPPPSAEVVFRARPGGGREFRAMQPGDTLASGDEFQLEVSGEKPVHVYVFHKGSVGLWACLYPRAGQASTEEPTTHLLLPQAGRGYTLDETPGTEETVVYVGEGPNALLAGWAERGVPMAAATPAESGAGSSQPIVSVGSPAEHINWYRRIRFEHRPRMD